MRAVVSKLEVGRREGAQGGARAPADDLRAGQQDSGGGSEKGGRQEGKHLKRVISPQAGVRTLLLSLNFS